MKISKCSIVYISCPECEGDLQNRGEGILHCAGCGVHLHTDFDRRAIIAPALEFLSKTCFREKEGEQSGKEEET